MNHLAVFLGMIIGFKLGLFMFGFDATFKAITLIWGLFTWYFIFYLVYNEVKKLRT